MTFVLLLHFKPQQNEVYSAGWSSISYLRLHIILLENFLVLPAVDVAIHCADKPNLRQGGELDPQGRQKGRGLVNS